MKKQSRFRDLLERVGDLSPDECTELQQLSCELDALDSLDEQMREGFAQLERDQRLERFH